MVTWLLWIALCGVYYFAPLLVFNPPDAVDHRFSTGRDYLGWGVTLLSASAAAIAFSAWSYETGRSISSAHEAGVFVGTWFMLAAIAAALKQRCQFVAPGMFSNQRLLTFGGHRTRIVAAIRGAVGLAFVWLAVTVG